MAEEEEEERSEEGEKKGDRRGSRGWQGREKEREGVGERGMTAAGVYCTWPRQFKRPSHNTVHTETWRPCVEEPPSPHLLFLTGLEPCFPYYNSLCATVSWRG